MVDDTAHFVSCAAIDENGADLRSVGTGRRLPFAISSRQEVRRPWHVAYAPRARRRRHAHPRNDRRGCCTHAHRARESRRTNFAKPEIAVDQVNAERCSVAVVSVEYRMVPEALPPAQLEDALNVIDWVRTECGWELQVIKRTDNTKGFKLLPKRWVVERTFGWLGRYRRLSKDYEKLTETSEAMIRLAMIHIMVRRLEPTCQYPLASQEAGVEAA